MNTLDRDQLAQQFFSIKHLNYKIKNAPSKIT